MAMIDGYINTDKLTYLKVHKPMLGNGWITPDRTFYDYYGTTPSSGGKSSMWKRWRLSGNPAGENVVFLEWHTKDTKGKGGTYTKCAYYYKKI